MSFIIGATSIIGIIFMLTFMFIGIWLFIIALKTFSQIRYKNYILEKINQNLSIIAKRSKITDLKFKSEEDEEDYIQNILTGDFHLNNSTKFEDSYNAEKDNKHLDKESE
ncbi:MAG: hypothetical protein ACRDCB_14420 [Clostridium sp.]|uniref:hypothetical protein n=1 Tax=Clostridium TaxID=1485 RepID=UPI001883FA3A|nr:MULTISPECIES: hypothetical protein [Clostridium]MCR6514866.1 hypothetical protein [Clostridium sp. LY3-2]